MAIEILQNKGDSLERKELFGLTNSINNNTTKKFTIACLNNAPKYFWEIPASFSGNFHPLISLGEGGLVRHTLLTVNYADYLLQKNRIKGIEKDLIISACLLHDSCKAGMKDEIDKSMYYLHAYLPRKKFAKLMFKFGLIMPNKIMRLIESHMGEWSTFPNSIPKTANQKIVHYADYLASRKDQKNIDIVKEIMQLQTFDKNIRLK